MRILIIRHGNPDYAHDSLTEQGRIEAAALADRLEKETVAAFYCSPLGRARLTAQYTLDRIGAEAEICPWLKEFDDVDVKRTDRTDIAWDMLPKEWTNMPEYYDREKWTESVHFAGTGMKEYHTHVTEQFDALLAKHGYVRNGNIFTVEKPSHDTIVLFCHFGLGSVLTAHLLGISPMILWHNSVMATTSVTEFISEERRKGDASFRMQRLGDISHLYAAGLEPDRSARMVECFTDEGRHD